MQRFLIVFGCVVILLFGAGSYSQSLASTNILFILDCSGSMWGQVDNVPKIATAKKVHKALLMDLPQDANVGLMAYGHRNKEDCQDVELLSPLATNNPQAISAAVDALQPKGKTPLTYSLEQALPIFADLKGQNNHIVLVSDGKETCGGDPCAAAGKLSAAGVDLKVQVVGFDVAAEERQELECIAEQGQGRYFNAENTTDLENALAQVKEEVVKAPPPVEKKGDFFKDDFDGEVLSEHWEVLNPNSDTYIVEDGQLLAIADSPGRLDSGKNTNIFRLTQPLPEGDYVITAKLSVGYQTGLESVYMSLFEDKSNFMSVEYRSWSYYEKLRGAQTFFMSHKFSKGAGKNFHHHIWGGASGESYSSEDRPNPVYLRITKKGRKYTPAIKITPEEGEGEWVEKQSWSILRQKGSLAIGILQQEENPGETSVFFDWVKIEAPNG